MGVVLAVLQRLYHDICLQAREAHKSAQGSRHLGRAKNAMEDALTKAAAGGGAITLRKRAAQHMDGEMHCLLAFLNMSYWIC